MLQKLDFSPNVLNMSITVNVVNITLLPIEPLFREIPKTSIYQVKAIEMNLDYLSTIFFYLN